MQPLRVHAPRERTTSFIHLGIDLIDAPSEISDEGINANHRTCFKREDINGVKKIKQNNSEKDLHYFFLMYQILKYNYLDLQRSRTRE